MDLKPEYIEKLAKIITDNGLTEISMEDGDQAITIRKEPPEVLMGAQLPTPSTVVQSAPAVIQPQTAGKSTDETPKGKTITSPMVGTFYVASSPEAVPFVEVGSNVEIGDVVCIIEAMKLMNEIKSEQSGKITKICVKNGDPVEFGQVLMYVE